MKLDFASSAAMFAVLLCHLPTSIAICGFVSDASTKMYTLCGVIHSTHPNSAFHLFTKSDFGHFGKVNA